MAVIADNEHSLVICRLMELEVGKHEFLQLFGHAIGDHKGLNELSYGIGRIALFELNDGFDGIELHKFAVFHGAVTFDGCEPAGLMVSRSASEGLSCDRQTYSGCPGSAYSSIP